MSWKCNSGGGGSDGNGGCDAAIVRPSINGSSSHNNRNIQAPPRWTDLHSRVKEMRRTYSQLFVKTPTKIKFRLISDDVLRIYFLLCPGQGREATLFYADLSLSVIGSSSPLSVQEVLDTTNQFIWRRTSREEQLLSERRRCSMWGITHYQLHPETGTLAFPAASTIFYCQHPILPAGAMAPKELPTGKVRLNPQLCPSSPHLMAYSASKDVYIYNTKTNSEYRVSHCHLGTGCLDQDPLSAGVPAYVMQEEFSRYQGYWWQPKTWEAGLHRLLYEEVDESQVLIVQFMSPDQSCPEEFRFPRAGANNATSRLRLAEVSTEGKVLRVLQLVPELELIAPWYQYLVRVGWTPCGQYVWCQLLERRQRRLDLILLPLGLFSQVLSQKEFQFRQHSSTSHDSMRSLNVVSTQPTVQQQNVSLPVSHVHQMHQHQMHQQQHEMHQQDMHQRQHEMLQQEMHQRQHEMHQRQQEMHQQMQQPVFGQSLHQNGPALMPYTILSECNEDSWIDVHCLLYWFKNDESTIRSFVWGSEESGHRHLYFYRVRLAGCGTVQVQHKVALTGGDWSVLSKGLWVDEDRGLVYFMGLRDTPLEQHLYVVSVSEALSRSSWATPHRLTALGYSHTVYLSIESQVFVTRYSSVNFPGSSQVYRICPPEHPGLLVSTRICAELLPHAASEGVRDLLPLVVPDIVPVELSSGPTLYAMLFKPHNFKCDRKYPVVLHIYGGPQVQLVTNSFKGCRHMRMHMLASHEMCVVSIDSRGSDNRGVHFQAHIKNRMGTVEIEDQVCSALVAHQGRSALILLAHLGRGALVVH
ncbi:hypothetical protein HAZT_HAZT002255 [Hyalella azteca]|uniref:Dipeptidylpeptidase IV N-terminal domain-containing protein n=1 Tax=Hyalella azteca TaxID=294128 RepID=A0A6A0GNZ7_HYAAZ|nr:hypothetical protein HAZT_HAZT002255 [Hyalella azteca]